MEKIRRLAMVAGMLALGAGIAALQLLATVELLRQSQRSGGVDYDFAMNFSYGPARILNLLSPNIFGNPGDGTYLTKGAFFEDAVYIGLIPLIAAIAAFFGWLRTRKQPDRPAAFASVPLWWGIALIALIFALGKYTPIFPFLYNHIPTFNLFQAPVRWHLWTVFSLSVLAGIGVSAWGRNYRLRRWTMRGLAACIGAVIVAVIGLFVAAGSPPGVQLLIRAAIFTGVLGIAACWLTLRQPAPDGPGYGRWSLLVLLVVAVDLGWAAWGLNPTVPASFYDTGDLLYYYKGRDYISKADEEKLKFETYFLFSDYRYAVDHQSELRQTDLPDMNLLDRKSLLNNFDPLLFGPYADYVDLLESAPPAAQANLLRGAGVYRSGQTPEITPEGFNPQIYAVDSICWHMSEDDLKAAMLDSTWNPLAQAHALGDGGCPKPSNDTPGHPVNYDESGNTITAQVQMQRDGWLVLADSDYPGWQATVDGEPVYIYRVNLMFRAVQVSAGDHIVRFEYHPGWLLPGIIISFIALLITLVLFRTKTLPQPSGAP